jgi:sulfofructose kinase
MAPPTLPLVPPPEQAKAFDVVCLGESSIDLVSVVDAFPEPDTKVAAATFDLFHGGQAATAAVACARLGWRSRYVGCLGTDLWGDMIVSGLTTERVDVAAIRRADARSRTATLLVERTTGRRTVIEHRDPRQRFQPEELNAAIVTSGRTLLVDATDVEAATLAARMARVAGIPTVVDVERSCPGVDALLAEIDILIVTAHFATTHTGESDPAEGLRRLVARFRPALAVLTLGAKGSWALCEREEITTPAPAVPVVDTTGAGDAFRAGFIAAWLQFTPETPVPTLLEYASAVAGLNCGGMGAQAALPDRKSVDGLFTRASGRQSK